MGKFTTYDGRTDAGRRRTPSDGKSSHGLCPGELKIYIPFIYAKFWICTLPFIYFSRYKTAKSLKNGNIKKYILEISLFLQ